MKNPVRTFCSLAASCGLGVALVTAQNPAQRPRRPQPAIGDQRHDHRRHRRAAALRRPRFHRADERQGNGGGRATDRRSAVERPGVRARIRHDPARYLQDDRDTPNADTIAFDRWRELGADGVVKGSMQKDRQHVSSRDAAVQCESACGGARPRVRQRLAQKSRGRPRTRFPTTSTRPKADCAASRGPS